MSKAYLNGVKVKRLGKSIEFNPYRHKGTAQEFDDFVKGYNAESLDAKSTTKCEVVEHPKYVMDAIENLNLSHPDYCG